MMIVQALRYGGQKKENEVLMASYNMDEFDNIILNERRQSQKALYYMILFMWIDKTIETENSLQVALGWWNSQWGMSFFLASWKCPEIGLWW